MSNQLIKINNTDLSVKEFKGQRVVTFKDIDMLHERVEGTAGRNFRENKKHLIGNEDYFSIKGSELRSFKQATNFVGSNAKELVLITESGYLMLVKSLQDDLAWKVQRELVNNYFRVKIDSYNSKGITKEDLFNIIKNLPNDKYKNIAVTKILDFVEEKPKQIQSIKPTKEKIESILNEFLTKNTHAILKQTKYGLAINKTMLYRHFEKQGIGWTETLRLLDEYDFIYHKEGCRTVQVRVPQKKNAIRAIIVKE